MEELSEEVEGISESVGEIGKHIEVGSFVGYVSGATGVNLSNLLPLTGGNYLPSAYDLLFDKIGYSHGAYLNVTTVTSPPSSLGVSGSTNIGCIDPVTRWVYVFGYSGNTLLCYVYNESLQYIRQTIINSSSNYVYSAVAYNGTAACIFGSGSASGVCAVSTNSGLTWEVSSNENGFNFGVMSINSDSVVFIGTRQFGSYSRQFYLREYTRSTNQFGSPQQIMQIERTDINMCAISSDAKVSAYVIDGSLYKHQNGVSGLIASNVVDCAANVGTNMCAYKHHFILPFKNATAGFISISDSGVSVIKTFYFPVQSTYRYSGSIIFNDSNLYLLTFFNLENSKIKYKDDTCDVTSNKSDIEITGLVQVGDASFMFYDRTGKYPFVGIIPKFKLPSVSISGLQSYVRCN